MNSVRSAELHHSKAFRVHNLGVHNVVRCPAASGISVLPRLLFPLYPRSHRCLALLMLPPAVLSTPMVSLHFGVTASVGPLTACHLAVVFLSRGLSGLLSLLALLRPHWALAGPQPCRLLCSLGFCMRCSLLTAPASKRPFHPCQSLSQTTSGKAFSGFLLRGQPAIGV